MQIIDSTHDNKETSQSRGSTSKKKIKVTVSITLSKSVNITVPSDYSEGDLKDAVEAQIVLPQDAYIYLGNYAYEGGYTDPIPEADDLKDWNVDDFEVIPEH